MLRARQVWLTGTRLGLIALAIIGFVPGCAAPRSWPRLALSRIDTRHDAEEQDVANEDDPEEQIVPRKAVRVVKRDPDEENVEPVADEPELDNFVEEKILLSAFRREPAPLADDEYNTPTEILPERSIRFEVPRALPGSEVPPLDVPEYDPNQPLDERKTSIEKLYAPIPALPVADEDAGDHAAWALTDLEHVAWENHPALAQAEAQVEVARGGMIQAGLHPNPTIGYEADTVNTLGTAGYHGPYVEQQIVTGGKLKLAQCAAAMEFENAQIAYQRTKIDIATRVRLAYYDLCVAQRRRTMLTALANFTETIYRAQIELVAGGQAAPYEPLQLRVFALQARNAVVEADNAAVAAGRRLGAAAGLPDISRFQLACHVETIPDGIEFEAAKIHLLECHTDLRTVRNDIVRAQYLSRLEYIRPRIPDLSFYSTVQKDYTGPPFGTTWNLQVGAPIPIFNQNQGNILATQSSIQSSERAFGATQNRLIGDLATILARFDTARTLAANYRRDILPDQVRTYRGVYRRYREGGQAAGDALNFGDVIVAQQTLGTVVNEYADVLTEMWQSYVAAAELLQVEDLTILDAWFGVMP